MLQLVNNEIIMPRINSRLAKHVNTISLSTGPEVYFQIQIAIDNSSFNERLIKKKTKYELAKRNVIPKCCDKNYEDIKI